MKSTESRDDAGKLVELSSATDETAIPGDSSIIENKRRRLVRGAVAFAPLVLTLRSGALAAATSCTGVKRLAYVGPAGRINESSSNTNAVKGLTITGSNPDWCVQIQTTDQCQQFSPNIKIDTKPTYPRVGVQALPRPANGFRCGNGQFNNTPVAIMSGISASSLSG